MDRPLPPLHSPPRMRRRGRKGIEGSYAFSGGGTKEGGCGRLRKGGDGGNSYSNIAIM